MLVMGVASEDDLVGVDVVFGGGGDLFGPGHPRSQSAEHHKTRDAQSARLGKLICKKESTPQRDAGVDQAKQHRGAHEAEAWHEQDREQERSTERPEIIEGENVGDDVAELITIADDAHEQGNLQPDQNAHHDDEGVQNQFEALREGEREHQDGGRKAADDAEEKLDPNEAMNEATVDVAGKRAADTHSEEIRADDGGELKDAVADEIAGERAGDELVDEAARRDQQHGDEQQDSHELMNRGGNDDADADGHRAHKDRESHVVLLDDLFPEMVRSQFIHHDERHDENENSDKGKDQCGDDIAKRNEIHLICLRCNGDSRYKPSGRSPDYRGPIWERF